MSLRWLDFGSYIQIHRFGHVDEIVQEELTGSLIQLSTQGVSVGHWYPSQEDTPDDKGEWLGVETWMRLPIEAQLEASDPLSTDFVSLVISQIMRTSPGSPRSPVAPALAINLTKRLVTITFRDGLSEETMSFRFKQLRSPMSLCKEENGIHSVVFSLKYPPKIEREGWEDS